MALQQLIFFAAALAFASAGYYDCPTMFNFYPDSNDCTKFYRCVWGKPVPFNCPAGTRWSQGILTCDHAYKVPCHNYGHAANNYNPHSLNPDFSVDFQPHPTGHPTGYPTGHPTGHHQYQPYQQPTAVHQSHHHNSVGHASHPAPVAHQEYHHTTAVVHPQHVSSYHPTAPAPTVYHDSEPDYYQNVHNYRYDDVMPMNVYEVKPIYGAYNNRNNGFNPAADLFRAGYGYKKVYYKK